jgi:hypothetical protein
MKKSITIIIVTVIFSGLFSSVAFADDPISGVEITYTAPDAESKPAKVERDTPADLVNAQRHLSRMRQVDGHKELGVSLR